MTKRDILFFSLLGTCILTVVGLSYAEVGMVPVDAKTLAIMLWFFLMTGVALGDLT